MCGYVWLRCALDIFSVSRHAPAPAHRAARLASMSLCSRALPGCALCFGCFCCGGATKRPRGCATHVARSLGGGLGTAPCTWDCASHKCAGMSPCSSVRLRVFFFWSRHVAALRLRHAHGTVAPLQPRHCAMHVETRVFRCRHAPRSRCACFFWSRDVAALRLRHAHGTVAPLQPRHRAVHVETRVFRACR